MPQTQKHPSSLRIQRGQAMIEYAILFILLTIIFIGGAELGKTALASYKTTDAAKTAISEYAEINQQRLNIINAEKQYLTTLAGYGCSVIYQITNYGSESNATLLSDANNITCTQPSSTQVGNGVTFVTYDDYVKYLDDMHFKEESVIEGAGKQELIDLSVPYSDALELAHIAPSGTACPTYTGLSVNDWDKDNNCELTIDEIKAGRVRDNLDGRNKIRYLLLLEHLKLANLPLDPIDNLTSAKLLLADHGDTESATPITSARCNGNTYDYGLPNRYPYHDSDDDGVYEFNDTADKWIYLFHPLAINLAGCIGEDNTRGGKSRLSILVNGHGEYEDNNNDGIADDPLFVPGLPKLNQAMYGFYTRVCVNAADEYVSCNVPANVSRTLLKPPGKICFENGGANADSCQGQPDEVTGFYHWGQSGTNINVVDELNNGFRPTFQLDCAFQSNYASSSVFDNNCNTNPSKVRIHTRYRSVFEGFLNFGVQELQNDNAVRLFYNPNNVSRCGTTIIGGPGSEIGYLTSINRNDCNRNGFPTLKPHKDFRGCYEVDVETNQVSACN